MQLSISISAGGSPASVRSDAERQVQQQLGTNTNGGPELAEALLGFIGRQLDGVPADASVSVSGSCYVSVAKPYAGEGSATATEVTEATEATEEPATT